MVKKVEIELSKEELIEIIAYYVGVKKEDVDLLADFNGNISCIVKKELAFPERNDTITLPPLSPWDVKLVDTSKGPHDYPNPLNPSVTWTADAKCVTDTGVPKWIMDDALATSETSKANDRK